MFGGFCFADIVLKQMRANPRRTPKKSEGERKAKPKTHIFPVHYENMLNCSVSFRQAGRVCASSYQNSAYYQMELSDLPKYKDTET